MNSQPTYQPHFLTPQQSPMMMNNPGLDGSGTINPASLNPAAVYTQSQSTPRGIKRSRSPETYPSAPSTDSNVASESHEGEPPARRKRGRPPKNKTPGGPPSAQTSPQQVMSTPQRPASSHLPQQAIPPTTPIQQQQSPSLVNILPPTVTPVSLPGPPLPTPPTATKPATKPGLKALPTVRDHTTDQLTPEGDEYIPREIDEEGEKKVTGTGHLTGGRTYRCRTFIVPGRGEKLFMLATECARVLNYRDSYLLFNKNRSLFKIIATQAEKDDLIQKDLLPYSYRSRQIAIVTAKSMFRQFGSRVITNGRRVRDDYWESKARKQGFTEEDPAGEKRPGMAKSRAEQAAAQQAAAAQQQQAAVNSLYTHEPVQIDTQPAPQALQPGMGGPSPMNHAPLPMINLGPNEDSGRIKDMYPAVARPRQEITGPPYFDQTRSTPPSAIIEQASQTADYNKTLGHSRNIRKVMIEDFYKNSRSPPVMPGLHGQPMQNQLASPPGSSGSNHAQHPQLPSHAQMTVPPMMSPRQMPNVHQQQQAHTHQPQHHVSQASQQHNIPITAQSPVRMSSQAIKPEQLHQSPANYIHTSQQQMWPPQHQPHPHMSPPQLHPVHHQQSHQLSHQMPQMAPLHQHQQPQHYQPSMYSPQHFLQQPQPSASHQQWKPQLQQPQWGYQGNP